MHNAPSTDGDTEFQLWEWRGGGPLSGSQGNGVQSPSLDPGTLTEWLLCCSIKAPCLVKAVPFHKHI